MTSVVSSRVGFLQLLRLSDASLPLIDVVTAMEQPPLDLSKATKLKYLMFLCRGLKIQPTIMALRTVESKTLQRITIHPHISAIEGPIEETVQEWQDLDRLLIQFWTSRSVRSQFVYGRDEGGNYLRDHAPSLLPELTRRGLVDLVEHTPPSLRTTMR